MRFPHSLRVFIFALSSVVSGCSILFAQGTTATPVIYGPVPGLEPSPHYAVRIRENKTSAEWRSAFALVTECKKLPEKTDNYFQSLAGWTHSYVNFEMSDAVEVEISRPDGRNIQKASLHPAGKGKSCELRNGKVYVVLERPCLLAVDIDGQMDDQDTGKTASGNYNGPAIHAVSLFANPPLKDKPEPNGPDVYAVKPGATPPSEGEWKTLYFLPGVHDIGAGFQVHSDKRYYIPGDAIVYGTFQSAGGSDGKNISLFGMGTISGARLKHPRFANPSPADPSLHDPILIKGASAVRVTGLTLADSSHHSLMLPGPYSEGSPNEVRWVKIFTWRGNGDGINPFANVLIEDCFIRTQDDSLYVNGRGIRRVVLWNDHNGSSFVLSAMPNLENRTLIVEDCDVIYSRAGWHQWAGGRIFNMRGEGKGACGSNVIFRNIRVSDPRPTLQAFSIFMGMTPPYGPISKSRQAGNLNGVLFQNISIAAPSILGEPDILWGLQDAWIKNIVFENLTIAGTKILSAEHFKVNEYVGGLQFR